MSASGLRPLAYQSIKEHLRQRIVSEWVPGTRLPPLRELAVQMDVGQCNILRAVRELTAEGFLASRQRKGTVVVGRALQRARSARPVQRRGVESADVGGALADKRVALLYRADAYEELHAEMVEGVSEYVRAHGGTTAPVRFTESSEYAHLCQVDADALVMINTMLGAVTGDPGRPLVIVNTSADVWPKLAHGYDVVSVDQEQGGFVAGRHAALAGATACFVGVSPQRSGQFYDATSSGRLRGFEHGWEKALPLSHRLACNNYDPIDAASLVPLYLQLEPRPRVIFAATDELAVGLVAGARSHGLMSGRDFFIIGFDGQTPGRKMAGGPLTTVQVPTRRMGQSGARLLAERIAHPDLPVRRLHLGCSLFQGTTTPEPVAGK